MNIYLKVLLFSSLELAEIFTYQRNHQQLHKIGAALVIRLYLE